MRYIIILLVFASFLSCKQKESQKKSNKKNTASKKTEVLLIGTFHFANFNSKNNGDVLQINVPDVLTDKNQKELERISKAIIKFNPDKVFVEVHHSKQRKLDSVYTTFIPKNYKNKKRNELFQLGFRVAKKLKHKKVYAIDYRTDFFYADLIDAMKKAKQYNLIKKDSLELVKIEKFTNKLFASNKSLSEMLFYENDSIKRIEDINWYLSIANQGGDKNNFIGARLASEWYKRNLYMYSIIQKSIEKKDSKIMILGGASHIAMFKDFINHNPEWEAVELKEIMQ